MSKGMNMKLFTKERPLTPSWDLLPPSYELLKKNLDQVFYLSFGPALLVNVGLVLIGSNRQDIINMTDRVVWGTLVLLIASLWSLLVYPGFVYFQSQAIRGKQINAWTSFRNGLRYFVKFTIMTVLGGIATFIGLCLFIIPGLILARGFFLAPYYLIDKDMGPLEALKRSYIDTKPVTASVWGVIGVTFAFIFIGTILGSIPVVGAILGLGITYTYIFARPLRYGEIARGLSIPTKTKD
jgi:hypothetical protein